MSKNSPAPAWCYPVPTRPYNFEPLWKRDARFNVVTSIASIGTFNDGGHDTLGIRARSRLLFADHQSNLFPAPGRLGSGRSGFFSGHYLKGVGLTPLAANWNLPEFYYNSGYLMASSAVREYLVSRYLEAKGGAALMVPCTGMLLAPITPGQLELNLRGLRILKKSGYSTSMLSALDRHWVGMTVKPGNFCRYTNILWALKNLTGFNDPGSVLARLDELNAGLSPEGRGSATDPVIPEERLLSSLEAGYRNLLNIGDFGVSWGSLNNNFTLDGRFVDLEVAVVFGSRQLGLTYEHSILERDAGRMYNVGVEVFSYQAQMLKFLFELKSWALNLIESSKSDEPALKPLRPVLTGLVKTLELCRRSPFLDHRYAEQDLLRLLRESLRVPARQWRLVEGAVRENAILWVTKRPASFRPKTYRDTGIEYSAPEYRSSAHLLQLEGLHASGVQHPDAVLFKKLFENICEQKDSGRAFEAILKAEKTLKREVKPSRLGR